MFTATVNKNELTHIATVKAGDFFAYNEEYVEVRIVNRLNPNPKSASIDRYGMSIYVPTIDDSCLTMDWYETFDTATLGRVIEYFTLNKEGLKIDSELANDLEIVVCVKPWSVSFD